MKILMVVTSHDKLGATGRKTGFWLEEFAAPYYAFKDAGAEITVVSPLGGQPPLDPKSEEPSAQSKDTRRFGSDPAAQAVLADTGKLARCRRPISTRSSIPAVTGRCGTWPKTRRPSP